MSDSKLLCWNINGVRSALKKGLLEWLVRESPYALCLQETRLGPDNVPAELVNPAGYVSHWNGPPEKGRWGVGTLCKEPPLKVAKGFGIKDIDIEGRVVITEHPEFTLFNIYFPNGKQGPERLKLKLHFYDEFLQYVEPLRRKGKKLVVCGDVNTAHKEIDIARPKENAKVSGFLPVEREWMDKFVSRGYVDTFRVFNKEPGQYSWWDMKTRARERNVGWRIDYFFVTKNLTSSIVKSVIRSEITGSDHCPIELVLRV